MDLTIREKIFGALYGFAIGDALGLGTEFMTRKEGAVRYPQGLRDYKQIIRDAHRSQWHRGSWTNDTEIVIIILQSLVECAAFDLINIAEKLKDWYNSSPTDLTSNLRLILKEENFAKDPIGSTLEACDRAQSYENTSECLGHVLFSFLSEYPSVTSANLCKMTHPRDRAVVCCEVLSAMADSLFHTGRPASYDSLMKIASKAGDRISRYIDIAFQGKLEDLVLDDPSTYWYVRKSMASALWAVWHSDSVADGIFAIVDQGGDADTNAATAGALLGLKYGYSSIPRYLIDGLYAKERIDKIAEDVTIYAEKKFRGAGMD